MMSTYSSSLLYLLGRVTRETHPSINFPLPSLPSSSFGESRSEEKRALNSGVVVANGTPSNKVWSSASVTREAACTRIAQEKGPNITRNFLEEDDVWSFRIVKDMAEDEFGAKGGPRGELGVDVPQYERKPLRLRGVDVQ
jgi:hypothetical protein